MSLSIDAMVIAASNLTVADFSIRRTTTETEDSVSKGTAKDQESVMDTFRSYLELLKHNETKILAFKSTRFAKGNGCLFSTSVSSIHGLGHGLKNKCPSPQENGGELLLLRCLYARRKNWHTKSR